MTERWARPARVLDIRHSPNQGIWLPDGRVHGEVEITFDAETIERMRAGYLCVKCLEPFEQAWPVRCNTCGAPIRDKQAEYFAREFGGAEHLGPRTSMQDEIDGIHDRVKETEQ